MNRAELVTALEQDGFEVMVSPAEGGGKEQICAIKKINGIPITFMGGLPCNPISNHEEYFFCIMHYVMMALAQSYGYGHA